MTEVDATDLVRFRSQLVENKAQVWGFRPGYNELFAKISASALRQFPYMNARMGVDSIELLANVNIGIAVDTDRGLLVPVIHDVDRKSLNQIGEEFREKVDRALQGRSSQEDLSEGTFTITNLGAYEVDGFTPIINLPEAAILGIGRITAKPAVYNGEVVPRDLCTLSLTFDHRLVDGAPAARFLQAIKQEVESPNEIFGNLR
jgi:pyruvate dehydrogenase E2 component (dihydrolipoamide acetyltransferase)